MTTHFAPPSQDKVERARELLADHYPIMRAYVKTDVYVHIPISTALAAITQALSEGSGQGEAEAMREAAAKVALDNDGSDYSQLTGGAAVNFRNRIIAKAIRALPLPSIEKEVEAGNRFGPWRTLEDGPPKDREFAVVHLHSYPKDETGYSEEPQWMRWGLCHWDNRRRYFINPNGNVISPNEMKNWLWVNIPEAYEASRALALAALSHNQTEKENGE